MIHLSLAEVAAAVDGRLHQADPATVVTGPVVIDSRHAAPGALFVAVSGERTDGHLHVPDAVRAGAVAALAARPVDGPSVVVPDPVTALGRLAAAVLRRTPQCRVVGVTGSSGKTSTKDLMAAVLRVAGPTVAPVGSFNNELGLPLTVLQVDEATRHLVLEYSARGIGHIAYLARIAPPDLAVVLNVGSAHLGEFGSAEAIARAKGELVEALGGDGTAVLNLDDPLVAAMASRSRAPVLGYGQDPAADVRIEDLELDELARARFRLTTRQGTAEVALQLSGRHHAGNAAAAAAVGLAAGLPLDTVAATLSAASAASPHRMQLHRRDDGLLVIDDAYNANPESVRAALDALGRLGAGRGGRSWAVLGPMRELGDASEQLHAAVGRHAAELGVDRVVAVAAPAVAAGATAVTGWTGTAQRVSDSAAAVRLLNDQVKPADVVLVKASNSAALWQVADALLPVVVEVGS